MLKLNNIQKMVVKEDELGIQPAQEVTHDVVVNRTYEGWAG